VLIFWLKLVIDWLRGLSCNGLNAAC